MFAQWVTTGVQIGIIGFVAVLVFALCCAVGLGILGIFGLIGKWLQDAEDRGNDSQM